MSVYITEKQLADGAYEGPEIVADSWDEAEARAAELGVKLVGELGYVTDSNGNILAIGDAGIASDQKPT